jgi:hypothetical protein
LKKERIVYGQGKSKGMMDEVDLPTTPPKKDEPYQMKTTTAKASWRK